MPFALERWRCSRTRISHKSPAGPPFRPPRPSPFRRIRVAGIDTMREPTPATILLAYAAMDP